MMRSFKRRFAIILLRTLGYIYGVDSVRRRLRPTRSERFLNWLTERPYRWAETVWFSNTYGRITLMRNSILSEEQNPCE